MGCAVVQVDTGARFVFGDEPSVALIHGTYDDINICHIGVHGRAKAMRRSFISLRGLFRWLGAIATWLIFGAAASPNRQEKPRQCRAAFHTAGVQTNRIQGKRELHNFLEIVSVRARAKPATTD